MVTMRVDAELMEAAPDGFGEWLDDHAAYLEGHIDHSELQRRNCDRYRNSPPICASTRLTDSQESMERETREQQERERDRDERHARLYRCARNMALISIAIFLIGLALTVAFIAMGEGLLVAILLQPLISSFFTAAEQHHKWRHFDE